MTLQNWFINKVFSDGIDLLKQHNVSKTKIAWIAKSENKATKAMLESELKKLLNENTLTIEKKPLNPTKSLLSEKKPEKSQPQSQYSEDSPTALPEVAKLVEKRKALYQLRNKLKSELNQMVWFEKRFSNTERGQKGIELDKACNGLKDVWKDITYYRTHGKLPDVIQIPSQELDFNLIYKRINTIRTYITKAKKGVLSDNKLKQYSEELLHLEKLLNHDSGNQEK